MAESSNEPLVLLEVDDGVATVTLNRPEAMNALSRDLRRAISEAFESLPGAGARVAILTGAGRAFCAGWDLKELSGGDGNAGEVGGESTGDMAAAIEAFDGPIIGAVNGHAITGGFELALACDLLVASSSAKFADTHARVGMLPGWGLSQKLPRLIGAQRAKEISFTGNFVDAATAERWGFVNRVVTPEELLPTCRALARDMASCVPAVLRGYKQLIDEGARMPLDEALAHEVRVAQASAAAMTAAGVDARREGVLERGRGQRQEGRQEERREKRTSERDE